MQMESLAGVLARAGAELDRRSAGRLADIYSRWFDVLRADTPELLREVFRIRYQVYCVENAFEKPEEHPDGLERDEFDDHAIHSLLRHRISGDFAGTVRLILPQLLGTTGTVRLVLPELVGGKPRLPMWDVCAGLGLDAILPFRTTAEVSRFAVSKKFRRRKEDTLYPAVLDALPARMSSEERRVMPHITLGLIRFLVQASAEHGVSHWCMICEPALLRLLARLGLHFIPAGPLVEHHGWRQPCYADLDTLLAGVHAERRDVWEVITDDGRLWPA